MIFDDLHSFVVDLMAFNANNVVIARNNIKSVNYKSDVIVIDVLGATKVGEGHVFDSINEVMTYSAQYKGLFTFDFYGDNAYSNSHKFVNMVQSELAFEKSHLLDISVGRASSVTNLKNLQGAHFYERYQVEVSISYFEETDVSTLRIDTVQILIEDDQLNSEVFNNGEAEILYNK